MSTVIPGFGGSLHSGIEISGGLMEKKIKIGLKAPDFTLSDTNGNQIHLSNYEEKKVILLSLIRGFA